MPQTPSADTEVDYSAWVAEGVEAIVVGKISDYNNGQYMVSFELIDVVRGQMTGGQAQSLSNGQLVFNRDHILESRGHVISKDQFRQYGHRVSDIVLRR